jgi:hypothetical protein
MPAASGTARILKIVSIASLAVISVATYEHATDRDVEGSHDAGEREQRATQQRGQQVDLRLRLETVFSALSLST